MTPAGAAAVGHVLLDADGVLQEPEHGWFAVLEPWVGDRAEEFLREATALEQPCLRGVGDFMEVLAALLPSYGVEADAVDLHTAVWRTTRVQPATLEVVHGLRAAGYGVHLGTNQEAHRAAFMRAELGYDDLFDVSVYSCEVGAAKPETAFFTRALDLVGAAGDEVLFVDDNPDNVLGARAAGLRAERWTVADGIERLHALLAVHDVRVA